MKTVLLLSIATVSVALADVRLPAVISDHMVLLAESPAQVWGWADKGEEVTVTFAGQNLKATASPEGRWLVKFNELKAGTTGDLTIAGKNTLTVKDVAVGEVWLASGQSNMDWLVSKAANFEEEAKAANFPGIRVFTVTRKGTATPQDDLAGKWSVVTPESVGGLTAVGYYFCKDLHQKRKVPVGLLHSSWGGTPLETWMPERGFAANPAFAPLIKKGEDLVAAYPKAFADYQEAVAKWKPLAEAAKAEGKPAPSEPRKPAGDPATLFSVPMAQYNGMIAPLTPYSIRGAIWYQGESNAGPKNRGDMNLYSSLFPTMILAWRDAWARAHGVTLQEYEFPFLYVQLANYRARHTEPVDSYWAVIREAQLNTLELTRTGMAVAIDVGEANDIHPKNKQAVGQRLALSALATTYFEEVEYSGPIYGGHQIEDGKVRLSFSHAEGLKTADGGAIKGFAIAGDDKKFVWAQASVEGDHVVVFSPSVRQPAAVRYAWADNPDVNLVNGAGLPASPFRTDDWLQTAVPLDNGGGQ